MSSEIDPRIVAMRDQIDAAARDTADVLRQGADRYTEDIDMDHLLASPFGAVAAFVLNAWYRHDSMSCPHLTGPSAGATLLPLSAPPCLLCAQCTGEALGWIGKSSYAGSCDVCGIVDENGELAYRFVQFGHIVVLFGVCQRCTTIVSSPD